MSKYILNKQKVFSRIGKEDLFEKSRSHCMERSSLPRNGTRSLTPSW